MLCRGSESVYSVFFFKQKTAYEMRISDWSSDVCSSDLYRLAEIVVRIPALAERPGDAGLLAKHFVKKHAPAMRSQAAALSADARAAIDAWGWPGNVRELENRVKRAEIGRAHV